MDMYEKAELRVLQHLKDDPDELIPDGMEEWEFNAACDELVSKRCIQVAWVSGHHAEAVRLFDRGRMRLKELEQMEKDEQDTVASLSRENELLKAQLAALTAQLQQQTGTGYNKYEVIHQIMHFFKNSEEAEKFLNQIEGLKAKEITAKVNAWIKDGKILTQTSSKSFYDILHQHGIYDKSYQNWNSQVQWPN